jgi:hypothetical protein
MIKGSRIGRGVRRQTKVHMEMIMRELSIPEVRCVSGGYGGYDDEERLETVVVTAQRIRNLYTYRGDLNGWEVYQHGDQIYMLQGNGGGGAVVPAEDTPPTDPTVQALLDAMTGDAVTSGQEAADMVNDLTGNTGDYAFREWLCDVFMSNATICELYVQP